MPDTFTKDKSKYFTWNLYVRNSKVEPKETYSFGSYKFLRTRSGYPLPGWRRIIASNGNATTNMSCVDNGASMTPASVFCTAKNGYMNPQTGKLEDLDEWVEGTYLKPSNLPLQLISAAKADNQALTRLYNAIRQLKTEISGGTVLGELRESVMTLRNVTRKIAERIPRHLSMVQERLKKYPPPRYLGQWVFGPNGSAIRVPDTRGRIWPNGQVKMRINEMLADSWLEFSFGIRPLVKDAEAAATALARYSERVTHQMVRGYGNESRDLGTTAIGINNPVNGLHIYADINERLMTSVEVIYRAKFSLGQWFDGPYDRMKSWFEIFGFTTQEFVPTVWNLLPYSFLVDYFVNVGSLLSAMTTDTSGFLWGSKTVIQKTTRITTAQVKPYPGTTGVSVAGTLGDCQQFTRTVSRSPVTQLSWPSVELKLPTGLLQMGNVLALLQGGNRYPRGY